MDDYTEIEKTLKRAADDIEMDDFSVRFQKIKSELEPKKAEKKRVLNKEFSGDSSTTGSVSGAGVKRLSRFKVAAIIAAALLLAFGIIFPIAYYNSLPEITYFSVADLGYRVVTEEDFYAGLGEVNITPVAFPNLYANNYRLYGTDDGTIKGGAVELYDGEDEATFAVSIDFYDSTVLISESIYADYDLTYKAGTADIRYISTFDDGESFGYETIVWHNKITYQMEYYSIYDNITDFFDLLFT